MRTTDAQVRKLMEEMAKHGRLGLATARAGMDRKTARKYGLRRERIDLAGAAQLLRLTPEELGFRLAFFRG